MHIDNNNLLLVINSVEILNYILIAGRPTRRRTLNYILLIGKLTVVIPGVFISNMYTANR